MSNELINLTIGAIFGSYATYHLYPVIHVVIEKITLVIKKLKELV